MDKKYIERANKLFWFISKRIKIGREFFDGISTEFNYLSKRDVDLDDEFSRLWKNLKSEVKKGYIPFFTLGQIEAVLFLKRKIMEGGDNV
ncbi:MAG: hypothetical protein QXW01_00285 [Candidatus Aenigmatarchaeota archaeon]